MCSKHVGHEIKLIVKQILCIKLVKYWYKYTAMHGQQKVKTEYVVPAPKFNSVGMVTALRVGQPRNSGSIRRISKVYYSSTFRSRPKPIQSSIQWISEVLPAWEKSDRGVKLNTHLRLIPRLRMSGVITPLPNTKWRAQGLMRFNFTLFYFGPGILFSCQAFKLPFLFKLLEKHFAEFPHLRVSYTDVIKFEATLLILVIILSCPNI